MLDHRPTGLQKRPLHRIFTAVTGRYDLINRIITLGMDNGWRKKAALACLEGEPGRILDLCCGTGDLSLALARLAKYSPEITGLDYSSPMLEAASAKAARLPDGKMLRFVHGDVSRLPFADGYFDCAGISFAFRNLTYKNPMTPRYMEEILRVLRPGGRFVIVESSQPSSAFVRFFFRLYLRWFVFPAGYLISGNRSAYKYLAESTEHFYSAEEAHEFLLKSGFKDVTAKRLFFGAVAVYVATTA